MNNGLNILAVETVERRLEFAHVPNGWAALSAIVLLGVLLVAVLFFYTFEQRLGASLRVRRLLAGIRATVLLLLALIWLEPIVATYLHRRSEAYTLVLVDSSASMSLPDRYSEPDELARVINVLDDGERKDKIDRWSLVGQVLGRENGRFLQELAANNSVRVIRFGDVPGEVGQLEMNSAASAAAGELAGKLRSVQADMSATDLGRAVRQGVDSAGGNPVAGIVVLSDGRFNRGEPLDVVAQYARDKHIPIYSIGIGDPAPPRNVAVAAIEAPPNVFVEDPFKITAHLRAEGLDGETLKVELLERAAGDEQPRTIEAREVQVPTGGQIPPVVFTHKIGKAQEDGISVRVVPLQDETITDDNGKETTVRALANKMRVLLVAGGPTWEYRYVSRLLERDATADVSCWLQSAEAESIREGNTIIDHFPTDSGELAQYDCIVLMDPDPGDITSAWAAEVEKMVADRGCGLLYVAGRQNTPRLVHNPESRPLLDMLPVVFDAGEADLMLNELGHFQKAEFPAAIPAAAVGNPVLSMSDRSDENADIWAHLGGVFWHYPVRREKPVATVLLRHSNPAMHNAYGNHVLLATQFVGSGRTGYLGFDTTWRWRRYGDAYFNRFWVQLLRHMVEGKLLSGQRRGFIQVERDQASVGDPAVIEARLLDESFQPLTRPDVQASIFVEGQPAGSIALQPQPNRPGWYRGQFVPTRVGTHRLRIELPSDTQLEPVVIHGELRVGRPDLEFRNTSLDRDSLELLASRSAGGRYLNIDEADKLPAMIPSKVTTMVLTGQPTSLWDRWWTMLVVVGLLGVEWTLRKRVHML